MAEQKCCCLSPKAPLCDLWPQKHFSQSGLKSKETKWCKKTPNPICSSWCQLLGVLTPGVSLPLPPGRTQRLQLLHHHPCPCSCPPAALLLLSVTVAPQQPAAFVSFATALLSARWPVVCVVCFREVYLFKTSQCSGYCCSQREGKSAALLTLLLFPLHFSRWKVSQKDEVQGSSGLTFSLHVSEGKTAQHRDGAAASRPFQERLEIAVLF